MMLRLALLLLFLCAADALDARGPETRTASLAAARNRVATTTARLCGSEVASTAATPITLIVPLQGSGETAYVLRLGNLTLARFADCVHVEARHGGEAALHARGLGYASVLSPHLLVKITGAGSLAETWMRVAVCVHDEVGDDELVTLPHASHVSVLVQHDGTQARSLAVPLRDTDAEARRIDGKRFVEFAQQPLQARTYVQLARVPDPNLYRLLQESRTHIGVWLGASYFAALASLAALLVSLVTLGVVLRRLPAAPQRAAAAAAAAGFQFDSNAATPGWGWATLVLLALFAGVFALTFLAIGGAFTGKSEASGASSGSCASDQKGEKGKSTSATSSQSQGSDTSSQQSQSETKSGDSSQSGTKSSDKPSSETSGESTSSHDSGSQTSDSSADSNDSKGNSASSQDKPSQKSQSDTSDSQQSSVSSHDSGPSSHDTSASSQVQSEKPASSDSEKHSQGSAGSQGKDGSASKGEHKSASGKPDKPPKKVDKAKSGSKAADGSIATSPALGIAAGVGVAVLVLGICVLFTVLAIFSYVRECENSVEAHQIATLRAVVEPGGVREPSVT